MTPGGFHRACCCRAVDYYSIIAVQTYDYPSDTPAVDCSFVLLDSSETDWDREDVSLDGGYVVSQMGTAPDDICMVLNPDNNNLPVVAYQRADNSRLAIAEKALDGSWSSIDVEITGSPVSAQPHELRIDSDGTMSFWATDNFAYVGDPSSGWSRQTLSAAEVDMYGACLHPGSGVAWYVWEQASYDIYVGPSTGAQELVESNVPHIGYQEGQLTFDLDSVLFVAAVHEAGDGSHRLYVAERTGIGSYTEHDIVTAPSGHRIGRPQIAADRTGRLHAIYTVFTGYDPDDEWWLYYGQAAIDEWDWDIECIVGPDDGTYAWWSAPPLILDEDNVPEVLISPWQPGGDVPLDIQLAKPSDTTWVRRSVPSDIIIDSDHGYIRSTIDLRPNVWDT